MSPVPDENGRKNSGMDVNNPPDHAINLSSSDSDGGETLENGPDQYGYTILSQDPDINLPYSTQLMDEEGDSESRNHDTITDLNIDEMITHQLDQDDFTLIHSVSVDTGSNTEESRHAEDHIWNQPTREPYITLNEENVEVIKSAMANFEIPSTHHPEWASTLGEDTWKEQLLAKIQSRQNDDS